MRTIPKLIWAIAGLAIVLRLIVWFSTNYTNEDQMITLRYAENLAHGHGLVYNIGERTLGTTTPLYTLFLALVSWMRLPPLVIGKLVNIIADGILVILMYRWLKRYKQELAGYIAAFSIAVHPVHLQWSVSGMETSLVTLIGVWAWLAYSRKSIAETYTALSILFLLRWDSVLLMLVITASILWTERSTLKTGSSGKGAALMRGLALYSIFILPWILFATAYFGSPIPVTGQAKMTFYGWYAEHRDTASLRQETTGYGEGLAQLVQYEPDWMLRRLPRLQKLLNFQIGAPGYLLMALFALVGFKRVRRENLKALYPPMIWYILYWILFLFTRSLLFQWYLTPTLPVYELLAALGITAVIENKRMTIPEVAKKAIVSVIAASAIVLSGWTMILILRRSQSIETNLRIPLGLWLKAHVLPSEKIMLEPVGYIGYYSERPVLDMVGLVSPEVLTTFKASEQHPLLAITRKFHPAWIVLRPNETEELQRDEYATGRKWDSEYEFIREFAYSPASQEAPLRFLIFRRKHP